MTLVDNFAEFWDENTNLELRGYPRKEVAKKAWDYQQAKFKEQAARIEGQNAQILRLKFDCNAQYDINRELYKALIQLKGFAEWIEILGRTDCEIYKHELKGCADKNIGIIEAVINTQYT